MRPGGVSASVARVFLVVLHAAAALNDESVLFRSISAPRHVPTAEERATYFAKRPGAVGWTPPPPTARAPTAPPTTRRGAVYASGHGARGELGGASGGRERYLTPQRLGGVACGDCAALDRGRWGACGNGVIAAGGGSAAAGMEFEGSSAGRRRSSSGRQRRGSRGCVVA